MQFRMKGSGDLVDEYAFRAQFPNMSLPAVIDDVTASDLGADLVVPVDPPAIGEFQTTTVTVEQDPADQKWKQVWTVTNMADADIKAILKQRATQKRWEIETGGLTMGDGSQVGTTIDDQNRISNVIVNATRAGISTVDFKAQDGWKTLAIADVESIGDAIATHVQACFTAEKDHHAAIDGIVAGAQTVYDQLIAYDVNANWPAP